jgi:valyl-tRNA synthetase
MPHVTEEIWTALPARETRLIVASWPEPTDSYDEAASALERVHDAAAIFRRAGVLIDLDADERRILEAVVRPDRTRANGDARAELERLRGEVARAERMLGNEQFVQRASHDVVEVERAKLDRYRRELDALERVLA